jgi:hypothetical protein
MPANNSTISPLRQRMIEATVARKLGRQSQRSHKRSFKRFAAFLKRSPDAAINRTKRRRVSVSDCHVTVNATMAPSLSGPAQLRGVALCNSNNSPKRRKGQVRCTLLVQGKAVQKVRRSRQLANRRNESRRVTVTASQLDHKAR